MRIAAGLQRPQGKGCREIDAADDEGDLFLDFLS